MTNPDQQLLRSFDSTSGKPLTIDSSPFALALGAELHRLDRERGLIELHFTPGDQFLQGAQVIQGGAVTAMLDFAMAFVGLAAVEQGQTVATATMNVAFLRAAKAGTYVAIGEIERKGRNVIFTRGRLFQPGIEPVANATSTLLVVS